jgi:prepilin-type N-terminal cleavage/methylation domain-containing protein
MPRAAHTRGVTLPELMAVVVIIAIMAVLAVVSFRKSRTTADVDRLAAQIRETMLQVGRRAVTTQTPYLLELRPDGIIWCQMNPAAYSLGPPATTSQVTCPSPNTVENGAFISAGADARIASWAAAADVLIPGGTYTAPPRTALATSKALYFGPNGTADTSFPNVISNGMIATGFTAYVRRSGSDEASSHRRVILYGLSGHPRVIDNW